GDGRRPRRRQSVTGLPVTCPPQWCSEIAHSDESAVQSADAAAGRDPARIGHVCYPRIKAQMHVGVDDSRHHPVVFPAEHQQFPRQCRAIVIADRRDPTGSVHDHGSRPRFGVTTHPDCSGECDPPGRGGARLALTLTQGGQSGLRPTGELGRQPGASTQQTTAFGTRSGGHDAHPRVMRHASLRPRPGLLLGCGPAPCSRSVPASGPAWLRVAERCATTGAVRPTWRWAPPE
ncbi:MAG: hypothetical protein QOD87_558, partial [Pseudonocardiales bacterium]|nr:hypothetical protein [Pseudonocardiales bacterium]